MCEGLSLGSQFYSICLCICFVPPSHCFYYCSFIIEFQFWQCDTTTILLFLTRLLWLFSILWFYMNFSNISAPLEKTWLKTNKNLFFWSNYLGTFVKNWLTINAVAHFWILISIPLVYKFALVPVSHFVGYWSKFWN